MEEREEGPLGALGAPHGARPLGAVPLAELLDLVAALHAGLVGGGGEPPAAGGDGAGDLVPVCRPQVALLERLPLVTVRLD